MKADSINLSYFLGSSKTIFEIPVFQRNYEWTEQQCRQLFDDLEQASNKKSYHFIGAIVYVAETGPKMALVYRIIDGQQRLMSVTLLLKALADLNNQIEEEIKEQYLINKYLQENNHLKLKPVDHDAEAFAAVMENKVHQYKEPSKVIENYQYFCDRIQNSNLSSEELYAALCRYFNMVYIELESNAEDEDPQMIFESLNSTGVSLSAPDLIRNFLLMRLNYDDQSRLYKKYWTKIERVFTTSAFTAFIRHYLVMKTGNITAERKIYPIYKQFFYDNQLISEQALEDLYYFANFYEQLLYAETSIDELNYLLNHINIMKTKAFYPYFMMLLDMADKNKIEIKEAIELVKIIESYIFRLKICQLPTNGLNRIAAALCDQKKKTKDLKQRLLNQLKSNFPDDKKVMEHLLEDDIYNRVRELTKLALVVVEEFDNKETIKFDDAQIEHIMPQRLNNDWRIEMQDADKVNRDLVGVLGNLTLTKYNSEMSNKPYSKKKEMYLASNVSLTREIALTYNTWTRENIIKRTKDLAKKLITIFPKPEIDVSHEEITGEHPITETLNITGKKPTRITINNEDFGVDSWRKMLLVFMEYIWQLDSQNYERIKNDSSLNRKLFMNQNSPKMLKNGAVIETNFAANTILAIISKISEICDITDEVSYTVK